MSKNDPVRGLRPNVARLSKKELIAMSKWRCKHGETGLSHYRCWLRDHPETEKIGFFDLECSNLHADFGVILTYAIKEKDSDVIYQRTITKQDLRSCLDKKVVKQCVDDLSRFDRLITWYGARFDMKFIRTRALALGIAFPPYGAIKHNDIYFIAKSRLCLSSNRLNSVATTLFGSTIKTRIDAEKWIRALAGDKGALEYIADHCRKDVLELERVYYALSNFSAKSDRSI